jgi:hypothetical protein
MHREGAARDGKENENENERYRARKEAVGGVRVEGRGQLVSGR